MPIIATWKRQSRSHARYDLSVHRPQHYICDRHFLKPIRAGATVLFAGFYPFNPGSYKMSQSVSQKPKPVRASACLLITESRDEFEMCRKELCEEVQPKGVIE